jgi:uncharacterized protein YndB with AHSA1/START domain
MADIFHDFPIRAPQAEVFLAISSPEGLDRWWTDRSDGQATIGASYRLQFGREYDWRAVVRECDAVSRFELEMVEADPDWIGTRIGFELSSADGVTQVRFRHTGWPGVTDHYRISCYCWAMYLRVLKRHLEYGEAVPYQRRLEV